jgi:PASTA domain
MAVDFMRVFVNRQLAINEGVDEQRALTLGLVGSMVGTPAVGYAVTIATARREAPPPPQQDTSTPPVPVGGVKAVSVPDVTTKQVTDAEKTITKAGLKPETIKKSVTPDVVITQYPAAGTPVKPDSTVQLTIAKN